MKKKKISEQVKKKKKVKSNTFLDFLQVFLMLVVFIFAVIGMVASLSAVVQTKRQGLNRMYYNCTGSNSYAFCEALKELLE